MKLGKQPARKSAKRLWLSKYINRSTIKVDTAPNADFAVGTGAADAPAWVDVLANDTWGDCFWAAAFRALMINLASNNMLPAMSPAEATACVLKAYSDATGFNPNAPLDASGNNPTDQGTDALAGMNWLQQHGFILPDKSVHKIGSYVWVNPQDLEELTIAHNLFDGLYMGVLFPQSWEMAPVWEMVKDPPVGGHEVIACSSLAITTDGFKINTWGETRTITPAAIAHYADEIAVAISMDMFDPNSGKSYSGFDMQQLMDDQKALAHPHP